MAFRSEGRTVLEDAILPDIPCEGRVLFVGITPGQADYRERFWPQAQFETLDIDPASGATYTGDICSRPLPANTYDLVVLNGVLEQVRNPEAAVDSCCGLLKSGGRLFVSALYLLPQYECPAEDKWRFTPSGLKALMGGFVTERFWNVRQGWLFVLAKKP